MLSALARWEPVISMAYRVIALVLLTLILRQLHAIEDSIPDVDLDRIEAAVRAMAEQPRQPERGAPGCFGLNCL